MFFDKFGSDDWRIRRRIVILLLLWAAALVTYIAVLGSPDTLREATATSLILLIGSITGSYVFGVIWDGKNKAPGTTTETKTTTVAPAPSADAPVTVVSENTTITGAPVTKVAGSAEPPPQPGSPE